MKKLLAVATLVLTLALNAAWEKFGVVQIADVNTLVGGITKAGEFTGNTMLGLQASSFVTQLPCIQLFGTGRAGVPFALSLFNDGDTHEYAFLYPIAKTQADFLLAHPGTVGKDGVIKLKPEEGEKGDEPRYVKFSADGKWVAFSDKKDQLDLALQDIKLAERPMKGDLVRLVIGTKGMGVVRKMYAAKSAEEKKNLGNKRLLEILSECASLACGVAIDDKGLALRGTLKVLADSRLAKCGLKPLGDNPLAFAGKDALIANAVAADCGTGYIDLTALLDILAKHGFKTDYLAVEEKGNVARMTLDIPAAVKYFTTDATNAVAKLDKDALTADIEKLIAGHETFTVENPAMSGSLAVKDYTTSATPAERVKATLPEIADKKPYTVQIWSLYAMVKAVLPHVLNGMKPDDRAAIEPVLAQLPAAGNGGIASAAWRDKDTHKFVVRISADEFKSISAGSAAWSAYMMQKMMKEMKQKSFDAKMTTDDSGTEVIRFRVQDDEIGEDDDDND